MLLGRLFENEGLERSRQMFVDQFESSGKKILYRKRGKGAPIAVTADERDRFIKNYESDRSRLMTYLLVGMVLGVVAIFAFIPIAKLNGFVLGMGLTIAALAFAIPYSYWMWSAPDRELKGRPVEGEPLSKAQYWRKHFSKISYRYMAGLAALSLLPLSRIPRHGGLWTPENLFNAGCAAFILFCVAAMAIMKWRVESRAD